MRNISITLTACLGLVVACGGSSGGPGGPGDSAVDSGVDPTQRYEPWSAGTVWSYKLTDPTGVLPPQTGQLTTLAGPVDVGGVHAGTMALVAHIDQMVGSKDVFESLLSDVDVRYRTEFHDDAGTLTKTEEVQPYRVKLDESPAHTMAGAQWSHTFTQISTLPGQAPTTKTKTDQWLVVSSSESITVPAGTFMALHVRRTSSSGSIQDYWYASGVGKVKETGGGQEEELESFTLAP